MNTWKESSRELNMSKVAPFDHLRRTVEESYPGSQAVILMEEIDPRHPKDQSFVYTGDRNKLVYLASTIKPVQAAVALSLAHAQHIDIFQPITVSEGLTNQLSAEYDTPVSGISLADIVRYAVGPSSNVAPRILREWIGTQVDKENLNPRAGADFMQDYVDDLLEKTLRGTKKLTITGSTKAAENGSPNCGSPLEIFTLLKLIAQKNKMLGVPERGLDIMHEAMQTQHGDPLLELSYYLKGNDYLRIRDKSGTYPDLEAHESPVLAAQFSLQSGTNRRCMQLSSFTQVVHHTGREGYLYYHVGVPYNLEEAAHEGEDLNVTQANQQLQLKTVISQQLVKPLSFLMAG